VTPSSTLRDRVLATVATHRVRTRRQGQRRATLVYAAAVCAGWPLFFAWGGLHHAEPRPAAFTIGTVLGALLLAFACAEVGWWRGKSLVGRSALALVLVTLVTPLSTYCWLVSFHGRYVEPPQKLGLRCLLLTVVSGGPLLAAALYVRVRTLVRGSDVNGAALGTVAGALGGITVDLWCPLTGSSHVLVGHVLPIVLLAGCGALLGRRWLALRVR
jgi:hypothetical protein